jgi:F-type H+-transporting ATPase subunit c
MNLERTSAATAQLQPEADGKITKALLLGCALAEGTAIFGMVVAILIILFLG